jgi:hypothetical protein
VKIKTFQDRSVRSASLDGTVPTTRPPTHTISREDVSITVQPSAVLLLFVVTLCTSPDVQLEVGSLRVQGGALVAMHRKFSFSLAQI